MIKLQKLDKKKFEDLPPRVIVHDILEFVSMSVDELKGEYDLFGYFKKDRFRNIWFVFTSLKFRCFFSAYEEYSHDFSYDQLKQMFDTPICVKKTKVLHLNLTNEDLTQRVIDHSEEFINLEKLIVRTTRDVQRVNNLFSKENCFPKTQTLAIQQSDFLRIQNWEKCTIWNRLKSLRFFFIRGNDLYDSYHSNTLEQILHSLNSDKLANLSLGGFDFTKKQELFFPNLEFLELRHCSNLLIDTGKKLKKLNVYEVREEFIKLILINLRKIREIKIIDRIEHESFCQDLLLNTSINSSYASTLNKIELIDIGFKGDKPEHSFGEKVEEITIWECHNLVEDIFKKHESGNVKKLCLSGLPSLEFTTTWPLSYHLVSLFFYVINVNDTFFQKNHFVSLETLEMACISSGELLGKDWNIFPKLKIIQFESLENLTSSLFSDQPFECLQSLKIIECRSLTFLNWGNNQNPNERNLKFGNLRMIDIRYCQKLCNKFFEENEFPELRELRIGEMEQIGSDFITGKNWHHDWSVNSMQKLKKLILWNCRHFAEDIFLEGSGIDFSGTLRSLIVHSEVHWSGSGWRPLRKLKKFEFRNGILDTIPNGLNAALFGDIC